MTMSNIDAEILELTARARAECAKEIDSMIGQHCDSEAMRTIESLMRSALLRLHRRGELDDLEIRHSVDMLDVRFIAHHERGRVTLDVVAPVVKVIGVFSF